ncbi:hypothetical protein OH76DRAFT_202911 [Lentinus brumalis]|uniref:Uncharacterized protein n=1 Tax=Lentinus brumalis TaxID=2498619 RepID=A0A371DI98_9APHY|nr:hypothetical protein OH76DRAFT_202911 [Polyporus brumalis]
MLTRPHLLTPRHSPNRVIPTHIGTLRRLVVRPLSHSPPTPCDFDKAVEPCKRCIGILSASVTGRPPRIAPHSHPPPRTRIPLSPAEPLTWPTSTFSLAQTSTSFICRREHGSRSRTKDKHIHALRRFT